MLRLLAVLIVASTIAGCGLAQRRDAEESCSKAAEIYLEWYDAVISGKVALNQIEGKYEYELWGYFISLMKGNPRPNRDEMRHKINAKCLAIQLPERYGPKYKPRIGMSKAEVERSTWGEPYPNDIRSMTTPYGKTECWFYGDYGRRSVCFGRDGFVNTITE